MITKFLEYKEHNYLDSTTAKSRLDLEKLKVSQKKNSIAYRLLQIWQSELKKPTEFEKLFQKMKDVIDDSKTIASKYQRQYWKKEFSLKPFKNKEDLLSTLFNIILKSEGLGVNISKKRFLSLEPDDRILEVGDYVICNETGSTDAADVINFERNNIGQIVDFRDNDNIEESYINIEPRYYIFVKFENVPDNIYDDFDYHKTIDRCRVFSEEEIEYLSKNKEDLETILKSRKYNL